MAKVNLYKIIESFSGDQGFKEKLQAMFAAVAPDSHMDRGKAFEALKDALRSYRDRSVEVPDGSIVEWEGK